MEEGKVVSENSNLVEQHYNAIPNRGLGQRDESRILSLKNFNNWVKSVLIQNYCRRGYSVLDLCGGKGGDLLKWSKAHIGYLVLADLAPVSVQHAAGRYNELKRKAFAAKFIAADCCAVPITDHLPDLDLVSCQFSLHYAFESEARARMMLRNVATKLKPGGFFIGTIPDANLIVKKIRNSNTMSFENSVFSIRFEQKTHFPIYGCRYEFFLEDAIFSLPEYLVHFPTLVRLAEDYDLELLEKERFHEFYTKHVGFSDNQQLFERMRCLNSDGTISDDEWEASGLYITFAFQKKGASQPTPAHPSQHPPPAQVNLESDIITLP